MRKLVLFLLSLLVIAAMILAGCASSSDEAAGEEGPEEAAEGSAMMSDEPLVEIEGLVPDMVNFVSTLQEFEERTGQQITSYGEAPELAEMVAAGQLPPVEERISDEPMVMIPLEKVGKYGGRLRHAALSPTTAGAESWTARTQPLLMVQPDLQGIAPNVAKGWDWNEDYTALTIYLRQGMKWSDGEPFNADNFMFWYEDFLLNEDLVATRPAIWNPLTNLEKIDDVTLRFHFSNPYPSIIEFLGTEARSYHSVPFFPHHYLKQFHLKYNPEANDLAEQAGLESWVQLFLSQYPNEVQQRMDPSVPTIDPWTMVKVDEFGNKFFDRNPYYWKIDIAGNQLPYIDGQDRLLHENLESVTQKIIAGDIDYALQFTTMDNYPLYKENESRGDYRTALWVDGRGGVLATLRLNLNHPDPVMREIFQNEKFRQAMSVAIDREEINEAVWRGLATPRAAALLPDVSYYEDWMGTYFTEYDPEQAKALLDEIGLEVDANGQRLRPDGKPIEINLEYYQLEEKMEVVVELVKQLWEAVGIKVNTKALDSALWSERSQAGLLDVHIWNLDQTTEIGFHANPAQGSSIRPDVNAHQWDAWRTSGGAQGEEPPAEILEWYELAEKFQSLPIGTEEYREIGKELATRALRPLYQIGIAGMTPKPITVKNNLANVKGEGGVFIYSYRFWMIYHPEQWYYE